MSRFLRATILSLLVAFACAQVFNSGNALSCKPPKGTPDMFDQSICNCWSGYAPSSPANTDCDTHPRCPPKQVAAGTAGAYQPSRPTASFNNDRLTVVQTAPIVANRLNSTIRFVQPLIVGMTGNEPGKQGAETCYYPGTLWTKTIDERDCKDIFTAEIPWAQAGFCGFVKDTNATTKSVSYYRTTLVHSYSEVFQAKNGNKQIRLMSTSYLLSVSFLIQKTISTNKGIDVVIADPSVAGYIKVDVFGDVMYDVATGNTIIEFRTTAGWPYQLDSSNAVLSTVAPANGLDATTVTIEETEELLPYAVCTNAQDSDCSQRWKVSIAAPTTLCNLAGTYTFQDSLNCRDNTTANKCPGNLKPIQFALQIGTTDLCQTDALDTTALNTYTLTPFFALTDTDPTFTYQTGDMIYWTLTVVDPLATLDSVTFQQIALFVTAPGGAVQTNLLFDAAAITAVGTGVNLTKTESTTSVHPNSPATLTFQYRLSRAALDQTVALLSTDPTHAVEVTTSVTVNLKYHGNSKRSVSEQTTSYTQSRTVQLIVNPDVLEEAPNAAFAPADELAANSANNIRSFVGIIIALFVALALKY